MKVVQQKTRGQDIPAGEVALKLGEITDAERMIVVGADWEFGVNRVVVLAIEGVVDQIFPFSIGPEKVKRGRNWSKRSRAFPVRRE